MADVTVHFVHPTDERVMTVTLDDTITAREAISALLENNFIPPAPDGYRLHVHRPNSPDNEAVTLTGEQTLADGGVVNKSRIIVDASLVAGGFWRIHYL